MENPYSNKRNFKLPKKDEINLAIASFSGREWIIFLVLLLTLLISTLSILESINKSLMVSVPLRGGSISEGIMGSPRFVNPILATTPTDQDMVELVYSGLMRKNPDGTITPDLAEKYDISKDGLTYTFTLKKNIYFQNGNPVKVDDIVFTVNKAKDPTTKSPRKVDWDGITPVKVSEDIVEFDLKQPYPSFLENATLGIVPQSVWNNSPVELNTANISPIGSGPYMVKNVTRESSGAISSYELVPYDKFALGAPYIANISLHFYASEDELIKAQENKEVDQISSITPLNAEILKERNYLIDSSVLPRVFGLFFNQNQNQIFIDKVITDSINKAIDKDKIIRDVLFGYGLPIDGPIPPTMLNSYTTIAPQTSLDREATIQTIQNNLAKDGWKMGPDGFLVKTSTDKKKSKSTQSLQFSISTGNAPELTKTALLIQQDLAKVGIKVDIKTFEVGNLNQGVIRPRKYDALLFGEIIKHETDLFAFWHSSQRKDPGLNVAMYTNAKVDKILQDAFTTLDKDSRIKKYAQFETEIKHDMPAVFLYSPNFIYVVSPKLHGLSIEHITSPKDRFANVYLWYTEIENVWKIFSK